MSANGCQIFNLRDQFFFHQIDFNTVNEAGYEANFHERLFLAAWLSIKALHSRNDHIALPEVYKSVGTHTSLENNIGLKYPIRFYVYHSVTISKGEN